MELTLELGPQTTLRGVLRQRGPPKLVCDEREQ
jgi:hypothetical protein